MRRSPHATVAAVMALALAMGWSATLSTEPHYLAAVTWPIGLVTGAALLQGRLGGYVVLLAGGLAVLAGYVVAGDPVVESLGIAGAQLAGAAAVIGVLTAFGDRPRATILSESDIARYIAAACAGAGVAAVVVAVWNTAFTDVGVGRSALELGAAHLASQLVLLPWFVQRRYHRSLARWPEHVLQWLVTLTLTIVVFTSTDQAALAFVVISALALGSRRLGTTASLAQLFAVTAVVGAATLHGRGVFVGRAELFGYEGDISSLLMHAFSVCAALVVVPLVMTVGLQVTRAREAADRARPPEADPAERRVGGHHRRRPRLHHLLRSRCRAAPRLPGRRGGRTPDPARHRRRADPSRGRAGRRRVPGDLPCPPGPARPVRAAGSAARTASSAPTW